MTARDGDSLVTVLRMKREEERVAAASLRAAQARHEVELAHLDTACRYLDEYRSGRNAIGTSTLPPWSRPVSNSRQLQQGYRFMMQLESAVAAQQQAVAREQRHVEAARAHWVAVRVQREAIEKLLGRRDEQRRHRELHAEQRQSDEQAMQKAARSNVIGQG